MMSEWDMCLLMSLPVQMPARSIREEMRWNQKNLCNLSVPHPFSHPPSLSLPSLPSHFLHKTSLSSFSISLPFLPISPHRPSLLTLCLHTLIFLTFTPSPHLYLLTLPLCFLPLPPSPHPGRYKTSRRTVRYSMNIYRVYCVVGEGLAVWPVCRRSGLW